MRKSLRTKNYDNDKIRFSDSFFFGFSFFLVLHFHTKQHRNIYFRMIEIYALMQSDDSLRSLCCAKITQFDASEQRKNNERNAESFRKPKITALNSKNKFIHLRAHDDTLLLRLGDSFIFCLASFGDCCKCNRNDFHFSHRLKLLFGFSLAEEKG